MNQTLLATTVAMILGLASFLHAHIVKTSLSIKGGESFVAGDTLTITWEVMINHSVPHRIYFSPAKGEAWQLIDSVPEPAGKKAMSYKWTVPKNPSTTARIRIFQSFVAKPAEQTDDYTIVSKDFSITSPTTQVVVPVHHTTAPKLRQAHSVVGTFDLGGRRIDDVLATELRGQKMSSRRMVFRK